MTKPRHRESWIYLPYRESFVNMATVTVARKRDDLAKQEKAEKCVVLSFLAGDEISLYNNDAQAVIDFLIL